MLYSISLKNKIYHTTSSCGTVLGQPPAATPMPTITSPSLDSNWLWLTSRPDSGHILHLPLWIRPDLLKLPHWHWLACDHSLGSFWIIFKQSPVFFLLLADGCEEEISVLVLVEIMNTDVAIRVERFHSRLEQEHVCSRALASHPDQTSCQTVIADTNATLPDYEITLCGWHF